MKSNDVNNHALSDCGLGHAKKQWVKPSLEVIALESAEGGRKATKIDGSGHSSYGS